MPFDANAEAARGILDIAPYIPGRSIEEVTRELGLRDVIKLASNENPLGPSPGAMRAVRAHLQRSHQYPQIVYPELQAAIADANQVAADQVITGNGADSILYAVALAYLEPDDQVLIPDVTFDLYETVALLKGARVVRVPMPELRIDPQLIVEQVTAATRMVFLCNPNNPTGELLSDDALQWLLAQLPERVVVVHDEVYREFADPDLFPDLMSRIAGGAANLVLVRSLAKAYGLAGIRFGYGIAAAETAAVLLRVRPPFDTSVLAQVAALGALADRRFLQRTLQLTREGRQRIDIACRERGLRPLPSHANFVLVDIGRPAAPVARGLLEQGVIVRTPRHPALANYLRISVGTERQITRLIAALDQALAR